MTAPEHRVIAEFDYTPDDWSGIQHVIPGDTIPAGHLPPERVAEMVALNVLEEAKTR